MSRAENKKKVFACFVDFRKAYDLAKRLISQVK